MPATIRDALAAFVDEHHVERDVLQTPPRSRIPRGVRPAARRSEEMSDDELGDVPFLARWSRRKRGEELRLSVPGRSRSRRRRQSLEARRPRTRSITSQSAADRGDRRSHRYHASFWRAAFRRRCSRRRCGASGPPIPPSAILSRSLRTNGTSPMARSQGLVRWSLRARSTPPAVIVRAADAAFGRSRRPNEVAASRPTPTPPDEIANEVEPAVRS